MKNLIDLDKYKKYVFLGFQYENEDSEDCIEHFTYDVDSHEFGEMSDFLAIGTRLMECMAEECGMSAEDFCHLVADIIKDWHSVEETMNKEDK